MAGGQGCVGQLGLPAPEECHRQPLGFELSLVSVPGAGLGLGGDFG